MSNIFASLPKYAGKWEVVGEPMKLDNEDLEALKETAQIVKSTWGKSFRFVTKVSNYQMYIPADQSVLLPIGSEVPIANIRIVTLHKDGEKDIMRVQVEEKPRI